MWFNMATVDLSRKALDVKFQSGVSLMKRILYVDGVDNQLHKPIL